MRVPRTSRAAIIAALPLLFASCIEQGAPTELPPTPPSTAAVKWVVISPASATVTPGSTVPLNLSLQDEAGHELTGIDVTWRSTDTSVADVSSAGVVRTKQVGSVDIVASSGRQSAYAVIHVSTAPPPKLTVAVSPTVDTLAVNGTLQLVATVRDEHGGVVTGTQLSWRSSDTTVLAVSATGEATGVAPGYATVVVSTASSSAVAKLVVAEAAPPPPPPPPPPPSAATLYASYSAVSPHWPHIRTMMTDFYYGWTTEERDWATAHYDWAMSGNGAAWRAGNPGVTHYPYTLLWTTLVPGQQSEDLNGVYYSDMRAWYAAHPGYTLETAFLHSGAARDSASRLVVTIWDSKRWVINPSDPGAQAYEVDRYRRIAQNEDGVFIDESASGDILGRVKTAVELPTVDPFESGYTALLGAIKQALGSRYVMINLGEYHTAFDRADAIAAGGAHLEKINNPMFSEMHLRWQWIDDLQGNGVTIDMAPVYSTDYINAHPTLLPAGGLYATSAQRLKMWELASYYMVVRTRPDGLNLALETGWTTPYSPRWLKAQEADIGHPTGARTVLSRGTDPVGQSYTIYTRDFDRALVVVRTQQGWGTQSYLDATAVTVQLPAGEQWLPLLADGTLGEPVTSVRLRNVEAVILIKKSRL
ncbi:MAG TPA: Ig-like domain-containing protein [Gemmatimonadaceae bacterium]